MVQSRIVYVTGNDEIDRILNDISQRLDTIEGLRPDLDAGYYTLDSDKEISTGDPIELAYVLIDDNGITITNSDSSLTITLSGSGIILTSSDGDSITITGKYIEIKDENEAITFKFGNWS